MIHRSPKADNLIPSPDTSTIATLRIFSSVSGAGVMAGPHKESNGVLVSGYLICKADSQEEVQEWSRSCPIHKYPNSSVEIRPLTPFPMN
ncbi:YciI family protein [Dyadobacter sp. 32]|uniref:YciI family protein n=1 Tax=Dyadobacter sp. 32 TaxID=538966 RepID=UPI0039C6611D